MNPAADYLDKLAERRRAKAPDDPGLMTSSNSEIEWFENRAAALALRVAAADLRAGLHLLEGEGA